MSADATIETALGPAAGTPEPSRTRPFYWSVRRELWENRSIYLAPLIAGGVVVAGVVIGAVHPPHFQQIVRTGAEVHRTSAVIPPGVPYLIGAFAILATSVVVAAFYCLGALYGERRDRTVLFWKSLPVSDLTTVLAKAVIPLVILPAIAFAVTFATHLVMLAVGVTATLLKGGSVAALWDQLPLLKIWADLLYAVVVLALWHAPIWGWLLMVSAWAKRAPLLWGFGPPLAICVIERLAFGTSFAWSLLTYRIDGGLKEAFATPEDGRGLNLPNIDVAGLITSPGLWIGLAVAAAFLAAAVWLRRNREAR